MMLNIAAKEYHEGIADGKIINSAEYEESLIFLGQASTRFKSLAAKHPGAESSALIAAFDALEESSRTKIDPGKVRAEINAINENLQKQFQVEIKFTPAQAVNLDNGKLIYQSRCVLCHGLEGKGNGPLAATLTPPPTDLSDPKFTGNADTRPYDNFQVINVGIANTAMVAWAEFLTEAEIWDVTYYIRSFSNADVQLPLPDVAKVAEASSGDKNALDTIAETRTLLDQSLQLFKEGDADTASEMAFDAYMVYESIEGGLVNKRKELGLRLESSFSRYRAEIKRKAPQDLVEGIHKNIHEDLTQASDVLVENIGFVGLFLQSLSIIVREGFEAILIIAALITFLTKSRNEDKVKSIYYGAGIGIVASFITAYVLHEVLKISRVSQELLEGWIMLVAVVALFWVSYWLVTKIEAAKWQSYISGKMRQAVSEGSLLTLGMVAFLSVYREGFETVLFYKALYLYAGPGTAGIIPGFLVGSLILAGIYYLISKAGMKIPIKWFFAVTSVFLYFMAFVFMGKGLHELQMGEQLSLTAADFAPEISWLGMYPSWETFSGQMVLALAYILALLYTFVFKPEVENKQLHAEAGKIQQDIAIVHDLVAHISQHAKRCEVFLKDTKDQDLKELSEHLKEIDEKVHELYNHVHSVEDQLSSEFERLTRLNVSTEGNKGLV
ncbi:MAG: iron permease [Nitrospinae bacterium CG11_big_fil_rev_8_21_14_0_20_45_15]|nr:MAG: iron permease [Nitrospinae bacterium CG11_big_fil_rev_8_21_14_0_20_45_15]